MSVGGAIGIDLGSHSTLIAAVKSGGVEVLTNDLSNRSTPTILSFGDKERHVGEAGFSRMSGNFRNTVVMAPRFLGLAAGYEKLNEEVKWLTCKWLSDGGVVKFEVRFRGETKIFTAEQLTAMYLTHVKHLCAKAGVKMSDAAISVPSYYTEVERRALLDAAAIADIPCVKLMNETTASALSYGLFRQKELTEDPRYVAIVDMGHSKLSVSVVAFTKDKLQMLSHACDRHLGGRDFDWILMEHFANEFKAKRKIDPLQNIKSRLKLATACEKLRKVLSANADAHISVECLSEDNDLSSSLTREAMESMCVPLLDRIHSVCAAALRDSGIEKVHSVEIVGGATRIPSVQARVVEVFQVDTVSRTMNAEEAVSKGCAVQAAMLSAFFRVKEYGVSDRTMYPINVEMDYVDEPDQGITAEELFTERNLFPISKILTVKKNRPFRVELFYPLQLPSGVEKTIARYTVKCSQQTDEQKLKIAIKMNAHGVVNLESVEKIETQIVEEMLVDSPKAEDTKTDPAEATTSTATKKEPKKKTKRTPVPCEKWSMGMSDLDLTAAKDLEMRMLENDRLTRETVEKKNELESMVYTWRDRLSSNYKDYAPPSVIAEILQLLTVTEEWIYGEGSDTEREKYVSKIETVKELVEPIQERYSEFSKLPESVETLRMCVHGCEELARSPLEKYSHVSNDDREPVLAECRQVLEWLDRETPRIKAAPHSENPPVGTEEIVKRGIHLQEITNSVMNRPKPVAKKAKEEKGEAAGSPDSGKIDMEGMGESAEKAQEPMEVDQ